MAITVGSPSAEADVMVEMNTTPLIDVMLVLLIMLIITIPIQTHAVKLDMPAGTPPAAATPPEVATISIDFDGTLAWNGTPLADRDALEDRMRAAANQPVQPEIHIRPDRLAAYRSVAAVLSTAQRQGLTKIGIIGNEQFAN